MYGHVCETTGTPEVLPSRPLKGIMFKDCLNLKIDFASALIGPRLTNLMRATRRRLWWALASCLPTFDIENILTLSRGRCKTSSAGRSAGLSIPRSSVRFRQKLLKSRTQIYMDLSYADLQQGHQITLTSNKSNHQSITHSHTHTHSISLSLTHTYWHTHTNIRTHTQISAQ